MGITKRQEAMVKQTLQHAVEAVRTIPNSALATFLPRLKEAQAILLKDLKKWEMTQDGGKRYTAHAKRSALAQLDAAMAEVDSLGDAMHGTLLTSGTKAGVAGLTAMQQQLASMNAMFEGAIVPVSIDRAAILAEGEKLLVKRYPTSAARYAGSIRDELKRQFSIGTLQQKTITEMTTAMHSSIPKVFDGARWRAERLVRTEVMNSYNEMHYQGLQAAHDEDSEVKMRWDASFDYRRCPECADLDGRIVTVDQDFVAKWTSSSGSSRQSTNRRPPAHPNCFTPETEVQGSFVAGLKSHYTGEMVEIFVESGRSVTVTPNHPILTETGWISAGQLTEHDRLLSYGGGVNSPSPPGGIDKEDPPARIDEVFGFFRNTGSSSTRPCSTGDLHGDAAFVDGDVEIVWADRPFEGTFNGQDICDLSHPVPDPTLVLKPRHSPKGKLGVRSCHSPDGSVGMCDLHCPGLFGHVGPLNSISIGLAAKLNASTKKPATDNASAHVEFLRELIDRSSGKVSFDNVRKVRKFDYSGHVYDLQSLSGWLVVDGILASNCRCVLVPWLDDFPDTDWNTEPPDEGQPAPSATYIFGKGAHPVPTRARSVTAHVQPKKHTLPKKKPGPIQKTEAEKKAKVKAAAAAKKKAAAKKAKAAKYLADSDAKMAKMGEPHLKGKITTTSKKIADLEAKAPKAKTAAEKSKIAKDLKKHSKIKAMAEKHLAAKQAKAAAAKIPQEWSSAKQASMKAFVEQGKTYQQQFGNGSSYYPTGDEVNLAYEIWGKGAKPPGYKPSLVGKGPQKKGQKPKTVVPKAGKKVVYDDGRKRIERASIDDIKREQEHYAAELKKLPASQRNAITKYTGAAFVPINDGLRKGTLKGNSLAVKHVKNLDKVYDKHRTTMDHVVYRGVEFDRKFTPPRVGELWEDKGFGSTSMDPERSFSRNGKLTIEVPEKTPGTYVSSISAVGQHERELLLDRGVEYRVLSKEVVGGEYHIRLRVTSTAATRRKGEKLK